MKKKLIITVVALICLIAVVLAGCSGSASPVKNGDLENFNTDASHMEDWSVSGSGDVTYPVGNNSDQDKGHGRYLTIKQSSDGVTYLYQKVKLTRGATYVLSCDFYLDSKISSSSNKYRGAYVGFLESDDFAVEMNSATGGQWTTVTKYFTPATSQTLTLVVGIGNENVGKARGTASFDNIVLEKYSGEVPAGTKIETVSTSGKAYSLSGGESVAYTVVCALFGIAVILLAIYLIRKSLARNTFSTHKLLSPVALFAYMMVAAFAIRFIIALLAEGMSSEINALSKLAGQLAEFDPTQIVAKTETNQPIGLMYLLWLIGGLTNVLPISYGSLGMSIITRLPFILADIVACYFLYDILSKRFSERVAIIFTAVYAVIPSVFTASTTWGMEMSLVACLLIVMFNAVLNKKYITVSVLYTVSLMFSNYVVLLAPLVVAFLVNAFIQNRDQRVKIGVTCALSFVGFYLLALPFTVSQIGKGDAFYVFKMMWNDLTEVSVYTKDAFNMYAIFGLVNKEVNLTMTILGALFTAALIVAVVLCYYKSRNRLDLILLSAFTVLAYASIGVKSSVELYVLGTALMFLYAAVSGSRRGYYIFGGYSLLSFLNMALILGNSGYLSGNPNAKYISFFQWDGALIFFSIVSVLLTLYTAYYVYDVCVAERSEEIPPLKGRLIDDIKNSLRSIKLIKRDK